VLISVFQLGVQPYITFNIIIIILMMTWYCLLLQERINRKVIHATLLFAFTSVLQLGVHPYFIWVITQMMYNKGWVFGEKMQMSCTNLTLEQIFFNSFHNSFMVAVINTAGASPSVWASMRSNNSQAKTWYFF